MGIRAGNSSERLRTIWTPEMDRYFIDLMLEQVNKGHRLDDHLFSKRAWMHMTSSFNEKFAFQCEKDVLKNRYKTLRNLYKSVKKLLTHQGFSWDGKRRMVTAENVIWDQYIKAHPDARPFRIKTIPYYSDLRLIYGDATIEQKGDNVLELSPQSGENERTAANQSGTGSEGAVEAFHDVTVAEAGIPMSKEVVDDTQLAMLNVAGITASGRSRTNWQPPMDRYFIDLMVDQVHKGNQIDGIFRKQAWMEMIASFNTKFGFSYNLDVLKNRYKSLRRQYNVITSLLDLNGFAWDDARQMVIADDYVWQDYIKVWTCEHMV
ncbi:Myb_DNA-bind_3 domain-containing protein, partial [Cephalotus follicularis]